MLNLFLVILLVVAIRRIGKLEAVIRDYEGYLEEVFLEDNDGQV